MLTTASSPKRRRCHAHAAGDHRRLHAGQGAPAFALRLVALLGGKVNQLLPVNLPGVVEDRYLVVVDKVAATPGGYPRKSGIPTKTPL